MLTIAYTGCTNTEPLETIQRPGDPDAELPPFYPEDISTENIVYTVYEPIPAINKTSPTSLDVADIAIHQTSRHINTISTSPNSSFAICEDNYLWAWGNNSHGQLGNGTTQSQPYPVKIKSNVVAISNERTRTFAVTADGKLWAWGRDFVMTGIDDTIYHTRPVVVMEDVIYVTSSLNRSLAIRSDGQLWAINPEPTLALEDVVSVTSGAENYVLAIRNDGSLWAWGAIVTSRLTGDPSDPMNFIRFNEPTQIMEDVIAASVGAFHATAITSDGNLWAWGDWGVRWSAADSDGRYNAYPVKVMENMATVSAGHEYTMAIDNDGVLWAWGSNWYGQLGDGTRKNTPPPVMVMDNVTTVSTRPGESRINPGWATVHTLATTADGTLWAWGSNADGQLGYCTAYFKRYEDNGFVGPMSTHPHPVPIPR